jgi:hypothetical protein
MALGTITVLEKSQVTGVLNHDEIVFTGDTAYPAGGTVGFQALVRTALNKGNITILNVITADSGGQQAVYDQVADKLKIYNGASEHATGDLSAITFRLMIVSK